MKGMTYFTVAMFTSLTLLGILFKTLHWPGAGIGLVTGVVGLSLIAIPMLTIYKYKKSS